MAYDLALAFTLQANDTAAARWIEFAVRRDESFAQAAVAEPIFEGHASVIARAVEVAREIATERAAEQQRQEDERRRLEEAARLRQQELDDLSNYWTKLHRRVPFSAPPSWKKKQIAEFEELRAQLIRFLESAPRAVGPDTDVAATRAALEPAEEMLGRLAEIRSAATSKRGRFFGR